MIDRLAAVPPKDVPRTRYVLRWLGSRDGVVTCLMVASLVFFGLSSRLPQPWLWQMGVLLMGCGIGAAAMFDLRAQLATGKQPTGSNGSLRHLWAMGQAGFLLAVGWSVAFGGAAALFLGWDSVTRGMLARPGLLLVAAGLFLAGTGVGRLLALDEQPTHGWEAVFRFPLRLAGLPALVVGVGLIAIGALQTVAPLLVSSWVRSLAAGWGLGS